MFKHKKPKTFRQTAIEIAIMPMYVFVFGYLGYGVSQMMVEPPKPVNSDVVTFDEAWEAAGGDGQCWRNEGPKDVHPSRVLFSYFVGDDVLIGDEKMVEKAIGQIFFEKNYGIVVYAFCR